MTAQMELSDNKERKPMRPDKLLRQFMSDHPTLTTAQLGDKIGVSSSCIRKWLKKGRIPQYIHLLLAKVVELEEAKTLARMKKEATPLKDLEDIKAENENIKAENLILKAKVQRLERDKDVVNLDIPEEMTMLCNLNAEQKAYLAQTAKVMGFKTITIKATVA